MLRLAPYVGAAAVAAYLSWSATDFYLKGEIARINAEHREQILVVVEANADELARAYDKNERLKTDIEKLDSEYTEGLERAKNETDALRDAVDDSNQRLHIATKAPANSDCPSVPQADSASMGAAHGAELDAEARRAYFNLRSGIDSATAKLEACQEILRRLTLDDEK